MTYGIKGLRESLWSLILYLICFKMCLNSRIHFEKHEIWTNGLTATQFSAVSRHDFYERMGKKQGRRCTTSHHLNSGSGGGGKTRSYWRKKEGATDDEGQLFWPFFPPSVRLCQSLYKSFLSLVHSFSLLSVNHWNAVSLFLSVCLSVCLSLCFLFFYFLPPSFIAGFLCTLLHLQSSRLVVSLFFSRLSPTVPPTPTLPLSAHHVPPSFVPSLPPSLPLFFGCCSPRGPIMCIDYCWGVDWIAWSALRHERRQEEEEEDQEEYEERQGWHDSTQMAIRSAEHRSTYICIWLPVCLSASLSSVNPLLCHSLYPC